MRPLRNHSVSSPGSPFSRNIFWCRSVKKKWVGLLDRPNFRVLQHHNIKQFTGHHRHNKHTAGRRTLPGVVWEDFQRTIQKTNSGIQANNTDPLCLSLCISSDNQTQRKFQTLFLALENKYQICACWSLITPMPS